MKKIWIILLMLGSFFIQLPAAEKQKVIFDCDLAGDVDDAYALGLLLTSPELDILGIVLDQGNTPKRAQVACRFLYEVGREDIPVYVGRLTSDHYSNQFYWGEGFDKIKPRSENAVDFMIETLRKYPNQVVLLTVGPVPNMLDILKKDKEVLKLAKHIYAMFGSFYMGYDTGPIPSAEWNVVADVAASKMFVNCGAKITYAGLDITTFVKLVETERMKLLMRQSPLTNALNGLYTLWRYESYAKPDPTLFDAVAVGMVLWPELFTTRQAHVQVIDGGYTIIDESKAPNCEIGLSINKDEFIKRMMERYLKQNLMRK